jgi:cell division protein FtsQ
LYQLINQSPVKIFAVECQDLNNLILKTELGSVHLGTYTSQLTEQFKTLAEIKKLPERTKIEEIDYIDLSDPRSPSIQLLPKKVKAPFD